MARCCTCSAQLLLQALLHKGLSYVPSAFCLKEVFQGVAGMEGVNWIVVWDTCGLMKDLWVAEQVNMRSLHRHPLCCSWLCRQWKFDSALQHKVPGQETKSGPI